MVISAAEAHCPSSGVNIYVVVLLGSNSGLQVPVISLFDIDGKVIEDPSQISSI